MYILFDIGGTKTRVAYSEDGTTCSKPMVIETPQDFDTGIEMIAQTAKEVVAGRAVQVASGGVAGPLDQGRTQLVNSINLPRWAHKPLKKRLSEVLDVPALIENDAAVAGLGEALRGAGQGSEIVVYITVSTGVGGVRIVEGQIDCSRYGFEPGHQCLDLDSTVIPDSFDLDSMISGAAVKKRMGKKPYDIPQGDSLWKELARWLSVGLANTIVHWSPDVVVLGGSMMVGKPAIPIDAVRSYLKEALTIFPEHPELKLAELGDLGGVYGALELAQQKVI